MKAWHFVAVALSCWGLTWFWVRAVEEPPQPDAVAARQTAAPKPIESAASRVAAPQRLQEPAPVPLVPSPLAEPDEEATMAALRESLHTEPERVLEEARAAEARFGPAAERAWLVARSLVNLRRFHEARAEAERAVREFPGTSWTVDLQRHLLVQPLDHPAREEQAN